MVVVGGGLTVGALVTAYQAERQKDGRLTLLHKLSVNGKEATLTVQAWREGDCLRLGVAGSERLTAVAPGPATDRALERVYFGHGYCVDHPQAFRISSGGHALATSHVGFEFAGGAALLVACDNPPDRLEVDPAERACTLQTHMNATFAFVPGSRGALDCAVRYRPHFEKPAASAVARKSGRFVFDIWGGKYAEIGDFMARSFTYGATDSLLLIHSWQRWGYDYRLPDIYPPAEQFGSLAEFRELAQFCRDRRVLFAPHDNYMDVYPEADGFSYDRIAFTAAGEPQTSWYNAAMSAQAYRAIPGRIRPLLERNLRLVRDGFQPNAYFIDVWGTSGGFDHWTREGKFGSQASTLNDIRESFSWMRDFLGVNAPQITEGGTDQIVGWADGAQAMHAQWRADAADIERIPWFDFAYHDRFIMHGVGYNECYPGGQDPEQHGVYSDDYMSLEVLVGHPAMVIEPFSRSAVRNYWLLHDLMRGLALKAMDAVEFDGGDFHRQHVLWAGGGRVWVNRGTADWNVNGRRLPQYGYYARVPYKQAEAELAVERVAGDVVEWSRSPDGIYVNPRGRLSDFGDITTAGACRLTVEDGTVHVTALPGNDAFTMKLRWSRLPWKIPEPGRAIALDETGRVLSRVALSRDSDGIVLKYKAGVFAYRLQ
jgi:hypothetical protein